MKKFDWKAIVPHVIAVLVFLVLTLVYFSPVLEGKDLRQDDAIGSMAWGKDAKDYHEESGEYSYWSNSMFSGMPCNYTYSPQPANVFKPIGDVLTLSVLGASRRHIGCIFATFIGCYILFLALGCKPWLSLAGSIVYTLGSYNFIIISAGHMNKSLVIATMAPLIGGMIMMYRKKLLSGALVTLIFAGLNIYWSHQQMSYYTAIIAAIMAVVYLVYAIKDKWLPYYCKATALLAVVAALSVLPAVGILLPTADYSKESMRGGSALKTADSDGAEGLDTEYAFRWSYGKMETLTMLVPNLYGAASSYKVDKNSGFYKAYYPYAEYAVTMNYVGAVQNAYPDATENELRNYISSNQGRIRKEASEMATHAPAYWGPQAMYGTSGPVYAGAIVCFLFVLGLIIVRGPEKWWLFAATLFSLVLAWGSNLQAVNELLFEYLPLYNKFRAPSQALVIATLTMSALAVVAVKRFMEMIASGEKDMAMKCLYVSSGIVGGITLILALFGNALFDFTAVTDAQFAEAPELHDALIAERQSMLASDAWRSFGFIAAATALMCALAFVKKMKQWVFVALLGVLFLLDMWPVCKRFVNDSHFMAKEKTTEIRITEADKFIHSIENGNHYRVLDQTRGNVFNQSFTSYYHNSIGGYSPAKLSRYQDLIEHQIAKNNIGVLNMLNTKYVINGEKAEDVSVNPYAYGHCWLVDNIRWVADANEEMQALDNVDKRTAIIDKCWENKIENPARYNNAAHGAIELVEYRNPGNIVYKSSSEAPKMAVFSEIYYKTWKAYIDGEEVTPVRANYVLRALPVPAGEHTIEFKCVDELMETSHAWSLYMSILAGVVIVALIGLIIYRKIKRLE
ncbi:MAG: hypothetical protein J6U62_02645 [Bacteroidaceae bacterium]|nr:hypothetical protein [Bacteroidaceae bacterium]